MQLKDFPQLSRLLGTTEEERRRVKEAINMHEETYSPELRLSIVDLVG